MPYIIVLVLVIAIVVVAVRKQKFNQKQAGNNSKANDIYITAEEVKEENSENSSAGE